MKVYNHVKDLKKRIHYDILTDIIKYGQVLPKKHGKWCKLHLSQHKFISLDTWSKNICVCYGSGVFNYWTGFYSFNWQSIGINFGGYKAYYSLDDYFELRDEVKKVVFMQEKWGGFKR